MPLRSFSTMYHMTMESFRGTNSWNLKNKLSNSLLKRMISIVLATFVIFIFYVLNKELIYNYFDTANINGRAAVGQLEMQAKIKSMNVI